MYVVSLHYKVGLDIMDKHRPAHLEWLKAGYAAGLFLASGRQNPPTGGIVLTRAMPRDKLDALLKTDPFAIQGLADYQVTEFNPNLWAPELQGVA